jgi:hypothetical protein
MPAPANRHSRAVLEIKRVYEPDPRRQVAALLLVLERSSQGVAEQPGEQSRDGHQAKSSSFFEAVSVEFGQDDGRGATR